MLLVQRTVGIENEHRDVMHAVFRRGELLLLRITRRSHGPHGRLLSLQRNGKGGRRSGRGPLLRLPAVAGGH